MKIKVEVTIPAGVFCMEHNALCSFCSPHWQGAWRLAFCKIFQKEFPIKNEDPCAIEKIPECLNAQKGTWEAEQ
jgi:hypothetical protein